MNMTRMFALARAFNRNMAGWDTSNVTFMDGMFADTSVFNADIGGWDTSSVSSMIRMFENAVAFNRDMGVEYIVMTNMDYMFNRHIIAIKMQEVGYIFFNNNGLYI